MTDKTVCKLKPLLYICLLFGYYRDSHPSFWIRLLAKFYCLLWFSLCTAVYYFWTEVYSWYFLLWPYLEYASMMLFSLLFKDNYVIDYYQYMPCVDGIPISKKFILLNRIINQFIPAILFGETFLLTFIFYIDTDLNTRLNTIFNIYILLSTELKRISFMLIFMLCYCRVNIMRETLETNGFDNTPRRRFHPQKYIQMYETLMDTLENTNFYVKLKLTILLSCSVKSLMIELFVTFQNIQDSDYIITTTFLWIILFYGIKFQTLIISAVLSDLINDNLQKIMVLVVEKQMNCKNERERTEIQKLYRLMQTRPYVYRLGGVLTLELRSLLSFISYLITTIIAIIQIKRLVF